jgi:hypothetical protein
MNDFCAFVIATLVIVMLFFSAAYLGNHQLPPYSWKCTALNSDGDCSKYERKESK